MIKKNKRAKKYKKNEHGEASLDNEILIETTKKKKKIKKEEKKKQ